MTSEDKVKELAPLIKREFNVSVKYMGGDTVMVLAQGGFSSYNVDDWYNKHKYLINKHGK